MVIWALYYIACGLFCPIYFLLGILGSFAFLGVCLVLFLTLRSHEFLLTPLGFHDPITLSFILRAHRLAINPLLSLLALLRVCYGPFSLFYITYCPWVCYFSLSGSFRPICFLKAHLFILWAYDPLFLPLGLNSFSINLLTLFYPCFWASSFYWASQNERQHLAP